MNLILILQDYLGGVIVFVSIVTALFTAKLYPQAVSPSLVALAINYTLLVPIYLNWVVKLLADLEMYIGAVERISLYINPTDKSTSDNDTDESPSELMTMKPMEKCEYRHNVCHDNNLIDLVPSSNSTAAYGIDVEPLRAFPCYK